MIMSYPVKEPSSGALIHNNIIIAMTLYVK